MAHFHVLSHTHWDREWYQPLEVMRLRLVDLIDHLLDILHDDPDYIFHLDAQTIVLEDYLDIRPDRRQVLEEHIRAGRILVGPWYVQNDLFLTDGESTVRNLMMGSRMAEQFGRCTRVGYLPDQFGLPSQMPQIMRQTGLETCIFGRGRQVRTEPGWPSTDPVQFCEFWWQGPDGSRVLAVLMPAWYNNAQRFSSDIDKALRLVSLNRDILQTQTQSGHLLLMNGVDHLEAQEDLRPILQQVGTRLPSGDTIRQGRMDSYASLVHDRAVRKPDDYAVWQGELREGEPLHILAGTLSSRVYLKQQNQRAQNMLSRILEPLYVFCMLAAGTSSVYPGDQLHDLWKQLLQNHPHDSICGCSRDDVHRSMEDRYRRFFLTAHELQKRGLDLLAIRTDRSLMRADDYLLTVVNTIQLERTCWIDASIAIPASQDKGHVAIQDHTGRQVTSALIQREETYQTILSPVNLPGAMAIVRYGIRLRVDALPGHTVRTYRVHPAAIHDDAPGIRSDLQDMKLHPDTGSRIENETLCLNLDRDGHVQVLHRATGHVIDQLLRLEDEGDCGDSYVFEAVPGDCPLEITRSKPLSVTRQTGPGWQQFIVNYQAELPERVQHPYEPERCRRSDDTVTVPIRCTYRLEEGLPWLLISVTIDNAARDHRLRAVIRTGIQTLVSQSLNPFSIDERKAGRYASSVRPNTEPNAGLVNLDHPDGHLGVAILNEGLYEYEHLSDEPGAVALTLLRSTGEISKDPVRRGLDETWLAPENQCLRTLELNFAVMPHADSWHQAETAAMVQAFQVPVLCHFSAADPKVFLGGRPAVQDSQIGELFYRPDPLAGRVRPLQQTYCTVNGPGVVMTALKKAEHTNRIVLRAFNAQPDQTTLSVRLPANPEADWWRAALDEHTQASVSRQDDHVSVPVNRAEITTLLADWQEPCS